VDLPEIRSTYVYEAAPAISADTSRPLSAADAHKLVEICDLLNWEKPIFGKLLAGWCVVAPICGALPWRPHIWVTGGASTGKTWVMEKIVTRALGDIGLCVASSTTEPGLRQALGHDARPVVFDEAEGEDAQAQQRIQNVMQLMRQASAETSAVILKGAAGGQSRSYRIRSCFAFASIGVGVQQYADKTRVTVLSLFRGQGREARERFRKLKDLQVTVLTEEYARQLQARAIQLAATIRRNSEIFAAAGAETLGLQRMGDQLGALLAGAYALHSNKVITPDLAREWLAKQEWAEEHALADQRDELMCLATITEHVVKVQGHHGVHERSIGELIAMSARMAPETGITTDAATDTLMRLGIKVAPMAKGSVVLGAVISNTHTGLKRLLANTPWAVNWGRALLRLDGAQPCEGTQRFGSGPPTRAVQVPLHCFLDVGGLA
jgi:putative DNA primase/helicase